MPYRELSKDLFMHSFSILNRYTVFSFITKATDTSAANNDIKQLSLKLYCQFREKVLITWNDGYFNPARLNMVGITPSLKYLPLM